MSVSERIEKKMELVGERLTSLTEQGKIEWEFYDDLSVRANVKYSLNRWTFEVFPLPGLSMCSDKVCVFKSYKNNEFMSEASDTSWVNELWLVAHRAALDLTGAIDEMLQELDELKND